MMDRDREVVVVNVAGTGSLVARIALDGNSNGMTLSADLPHREWTWHGWRIRMSTLAKR